MTLRVLLDMWRAHQGACAILASFIVMGLAWLHVLIGYRTPAGRRSPPRWYVGYDPPPFLEPCKWDLRELNQAYSPKPEQSKD